MSINFGALNKGPGREQAVHPRDIFNALPNKPRGMDYLRGPQDQVLQEWWSRRPARDLVIKMNTGGGKTIVGLLVAQSSLAEGAGPAAYLVPDHYLAEQVIAEAGRLGIAVTDNARDMDYARGRAILVDVFQRLFNGQSVFGVDGSAGRTAAVPAPGTIIIDDAHACLGKAEHAFRLTVPRDEPRLRHAPGLIPGRDRAAIARLLPGPGRRPRPRDPGGSVLGLDRPAARGPGNAAPAQRRGAVHFRLAAAWPTSCPTAARSSRPVPSRSRPRASTPMSFPGSGRPAGASI